MRVGVTAIGYECAQHLAKVLEPWNILKKTAKTKHAFYISASHGIFPETHQLGFPLYSTDGSIARLNEYLKEGVLDNLIIAEKPMFERDLRNITLPFLIDKDVEVLILLDLSDEIYTPAQILDTLEFIENNPDYPWFKINFKNYVFDEYTYVDDFIAPRIWRTTIPKDNLAGFYYDNEMVYHTGFTQSQYPHLVIPRDIAFVKHLSWVGSKDYLKRKIGFQHNHYGQCSYKWDDAQNKLTFDEDYYSRNRVSKPTIYHD